METDPSNPATAKNVPYSGCDQSAHQTGEECSNIIEGTSSHDVSLYSSSESESNIDWVSDIDGGILVKKY